MQLAVLVLCPIAVTFSASADIRTASEPPVASWSAVAIDPASPGAKPRRLRGQHRQRFRYRFEKSLTRFASKLSSQKPLSRRETTNGSPQGRGWGEGIADRRYVAAVKDGIAERPQPDEGGVFDDGFGKAAHSMTFQYPPLSGPTRIKKPASRSFLMARSIALSDFPRRSAS